MSCIFQHFRYFLSNLLDFKAEQFHLHGAGTYREFQLDFLQREFLIGLFVVRCTIWLAIRKHCRPKQVLRKYLSVML